MIASVEFCLHDFVNNNHSHKKNKLQLSDKQGVATISVSETRHKESNIDISFKVNLENFCDKEINDQDIYFFTIGKSAPHETNDVEAFDFDLAYKSEVIKVNKNVLAWKMIHLDSYTLGDDDANTNLVFQFYKIDSVGRYLGIGTSHLTYGQILKAE